MDDYESRRPASLHTNYSRPMNTSVSNSIRHPVATPGRGPPGAGFQRGHSDSNVLLQSTAPHNSSSSSFLLQNGTPQQFGTWQDFLRQMPDGETNSLEGEGSAARREMMVMQDRKRRLQETSVDTNRRRAASALSWGGPYRAHSRAHGFNNEVEPGNPGAHSGRRFSANMNRPLPAPPTQTTRNEADPGDYVLPPWQPDSEAAECPICGKAFGFWFRKHHCRKCGRVVCATCSPHRIAIPRQYIVHPPEELDLDAFGQQKAPQVIDLTRDDGESNHASPANVLLPSSQENSNSLQSSFVTGIQEVRLCNPCVPDPNILPPPSYAVNIPNLSNPGLPPLITSRITDSVSRYSQNYTSTPPRASLATENLEELRRTDPLQRHLVKIYPSPNSENQHSGIRSLIADAIHQQSVSTTSHFPGPSTHGGDRSAQRTTSSEQALLPPSSQFPVNYPTAFGSAPGSSFHHHYIPASQPVQSHLIRSHHRHHASSSDILSHPRHRSLIEGDQTRHHRSTHSLPPQPQLREEDECPICHNELPPLGPNGSEISREAHISTCIETYFSSSHRASHRSTGSIVAVAASGSVAADETRSISVAEPAVTLEPSEASLPRRRTTGMIVYRASEKDCIGPDGTQQECVICFEDFVVGDEMGRLECLCRYHKNCIRQWWDTKGPGACPVHQGGF